MHDLCRHKAWSVFCLYLFEIRIRLIAFFLSVYLIIQPLCCAHKDIFVTKKVFQLFIALCTLSLFIPKLIWHNSQILVI